MQTHNYGINGSQVNELGQHLPPMQVYGKYEPHADMARSICRGLSKTRVWDLVVEFHEKNGRMPSKYWSGDPLPGLKGHSFNVPGLGYCFLDIDHDENPEHVK